MRIYYDNKLTTDQRLSPAMLTVNVPAERWYQWTLIRTLQRAHKL